jgi:hypothetical protein
MEKELSSLEGMLDASKKQFLEEDLTSLDFEIEELESRLAFSVTTEGSNSCYSCCAPGS